MSVVSWLDNYHSDVNFIVRSFIGTVIRKGGNIKTLKWFNNDKSKELPNILRFPGKAFSRVEYLYCGGLSTNYGTYQQLLKACKNITNLEIHSYQKSDERNLATLIRSQNNLRHIACHSISGGTWRLTAALRSQARSLRSVKFVKVNFTDVSLKGLIGCDNVETLEIFDCSGIDIEKFWEPIIERSEFRLKRLCLVRVSILPVAIEKIMVRANEKLEEVTIDRRVMDEMPYFLEMLSNNCPNISYLKIFLRDIGEIQLLFSCAITWSKLKTLVIRTSYVNVDEVLPSLAKFVPISLRLLDINMKISPKPLESFLEDCEAPIMKLTLDRDSITNEHLKVLTKYALEKKSLKSVVFAHTYGWGGSRISEEVENRAKEVFELDESTELDDFFFLCADNNDNLSEWW
ncbi:5108_t:CDS:1 [Acaulospora colombiana]|uniref:5108_t:CDS:1 n=1 Tax=Acaulospora colombiana TaxID=27376 RepID=A0ACA9M9Z0_9GLOM|nr:5108_t:CDS:1 [Acaulospora colombiana]